MNAWGVTYTPEARLDLLRLDKSQRGLAQKAIDRVSRNPLPNTEGGYGKPLRGALSGCMKIKLLRLGIRVVYRLHRTEHGMEVVVIGVRSDNEVYDVAVERLKKMIN